MTSPASLFIYKTTMAKATKKAASKEVKKAAKAVKVEKKVEKVDDGLVTVFLPADMEVSPMRVNINDSISEYERGVSYRVEPGVADVLSARLGVDVTKQ